MKAHGIRKEITVETLKELAKDPNVYIIYNIHTIESGLWKKWGKEDQCPPYEDCFRLKQLKKVVENADLNGLDTIVLRVKHWRECLIRFDAK